MARMRATLTACWPSSSSRPFKWPDRACRPLPAEPATGVEGCQTNRAGEETSWAPKATLERLASPGWREAAAALGDHYPHGRRPGTGLRAQSD
jgi:hypothetical protein